NQYIDELGQMEALGSAYDPEMGEGLIGLAQLYYQAGFYDDALENYRAAMHISKINDGLYSLSQEPALRGMIESSAALGDWDEASQGMDKLFTISEREYGAADPRMLPLLLELVQWHLHAFENRDKISLNHAVNALNLSALAINIVQLNYGTTDSRLIDLFKFNALSNYHVAKFMRDQADEFSDLQFGRFGSRPEDDRERMEAVRTLTNSYRNGINAYEKIIAVLNDSTASTNLEKAEAYAELGDWFLLFGRMDSATKSYERALSLFDTETEKTAAANALFGELRVLPVTSPDNIFEQPDQGNQYQVEVSMKVTMRGTVRSVDVISIEPQAGDDKFARKIRKALSSNRFRPSFGEGGLAGRDVPSLKFKFRDG
ncbi:MAG: tetratricopeptide repeat protein, partial [bacterium]